MAADARVGVVRAEHHRDGVPADDPPDPLLQRLVAREERLLLRADRVDVARLGERRQADVQLAGPLQELVHRGIGRGSRPRRSTTWSSESSHSCVSAGSMSGSWCLNSSKYMAGPRAGRTADGRPPAAAADQTGFRLASAAAG